MTLSVRVVASCDHAHVANMVRDYLAEIAPQLDPPNANRIARFWTNPNRRAYGFYDAENALVGFALIRILQDGTHEMSEFCIAPSHRRRGLGRDALRQVLRRHPGDWRLGLAAGSVQAAAFWSSALRIYDPIKGPPLTPHQTGSLHFSVKEPAT